MCLSEEGLEDPKELSLLEDIFKDESMVDETHEEGAFDSIAGVDAESFELFPNYVLSRRPRYSQQVVTLYSKMDTSGAIRGVHLEKVLKRVSISDDDRLEISDPDKSHIYKGLSFYNPMHKHNQKLD